MLYSVTKNRKEVINIEKKGHHLWVAARQKIISFSKILQHFLLCEIQCILMKCNIFLCLTLSGNIFCYPITLSLVVTYFYLTSFFFLVSSTPLFLNKNRKAIKHLVNGTYPKTSFVYSACYLNFLKKKINK